MHRDIILVKEIRTLLTKATVKNVVGLKILAMRKTIMTLLRLKNIAENKVLIVETVREHHGILVAPTSGRKIRWPWRLMNPQGHLRCYPKTKQVQTESRKLVERRERKIMEERKTK